MRIAPLWLVIFLLVLPVAHCADSELYQADEEGVILAAARSIIASDPDCALITLDENARPRVRTVTASAPDENMVIWVATRPDTRKVRQISQNGKVALYFDDDEAASYVSIMGTATLHDDQATKVAKNFYDPARLKMFWPDFPDDYLLIRIEPDWIEVMGHGIQGHPRTWRPQAVVVKK